MFLGDLKSRQWVRKLYINSLLYVNVSQRYFCVSETFRRKVVRPTPFSTCLPEEGRTMWEFFFVVFAAGHLEIELVNSHQEENHALPVSV